MKAWFFRIAAVFLGLAGGLLAWQGGVALLHWIDPPPKPVGPGQHAALRERLDENPHSLFLFDEVLSYRLKPSFRGIRAGTEDLLHETNSLGLLGRGEVPDDPDVTRILFLGDSVTYGDRVGFEKSFPFIVQYRAGEDVYVGNAACPGWSTHQELAFYERQLADFDWDLVVLVFCLNDLVRFEWVFESEVGIRMSPEIRRTEGIGVVSESVDALRLGALRRRLIGDPKTRELGELKMAALYAFHPPRWDEYEREVLAPRLGGGKIPNLLVVAMPSGLQLLADVAGAPEEKCFYPQRRLADACARLGVPYLDATPAFRGAGVPGSFFLDALHLTPEGHRRLADFLWREIRKRL